MSSNQTPDPDAFRDFEHAGWTSNVSEYEAAFTRLTRQAVAPLLDAVNLRHGARLLDVATGPGYVAAAAAARGARALGIDFSAPMVAHARAINPAVEFQEGDAEALSLEDCSFDAVVMNFGMLHLARPERAMTEAARVLKPGGCFAFTVWARPEEAVGFDIILKAIQSHGNPGVQLPQGPSFFRFSDPAECDRTLRETGFLNVRVTSIPQVWRFNAPGGLFDANYNGAVRIKALLRAQSDQPIELLQIDETSGRQQIAKLAALRARRDNGKVQRTLDGLRRAAEGTENTMPFLLDAVRAYATLGEICDALRGVFGTYQETSHI